MKSLHHTIAKIESQITPAMRIRAHLKKARTSKSRAAACAHMAEIAKILTEECLRQGEHFAEWWAQQQFDITPGEIDFAFHCFNAAPEGRAAFLQNLYRKHQAG